MTNTKTISLLSFFRTSPLEAANFLISLEHSLKEITMNQAEMKAIVDASNDTLNAAMVQLDKVIAEVGVLQTQLANTDNTLDQSVADSIARLAATTTALKAKVQTVDDLNADATIDTTTIDPIRVASDSVEAVNATAEVANTDTGVVDPNAGITSLSGSSPS